MLNKRAKFKELAEKRVNNTIKNLQLIGNLSNTNNYDYSLEEVSKIFKTLREELQKAESRFKLNEKKDKFKL